MKSKETDNLYGNDNVNHTLLYDPIEDTPEFMQIKDELIKRMEVFRAEYVKEAERVYEEIGVWPPISHRLCLKQKEIYWYTEGVRQLNGVRLITMSYEEDPMYDIAGAGIGR